MTLHNYRLTCLNAQLLRGGEPCHLCVGHSPWSGVRYRCYRNSYLTSAAAAISISLNRRLGTFEKGVDRFLVFTDFQRNLMIEAGVPSERLDVVPNFVADPGYRQNDPSASDMLLYVGRLSPEKGVEQLIDAWARARPSRLRLVVVGDGPLHAELVSREVPSVTFRGNLSRQEVRSLMLSARSLLYPSICYEGQPLVLLEALASGLPIVAPLLGGVGATLDTACFPVEGGNWDDVLAGLSDISDDSLRDLSAVSRRRYLDEFTSATALSKLLNTYSNVLEQADR